MSDDAYLAALGRERAQYAISPRHYERVLMVDAELSKLGYAADDQGNVRKLPPVERVEEQINNTAVKGPRRGRPPKERAVDSAPERAVEG